MNQKQTTGTHSTTLQKRPLVTLLVLACNFEKFTREAIASAFAQTYSPLEIILSDDCSQDGTFEVMRKMASEYHGPHTVRLIQSKERQGLGAHISRLFAMAAGELHIILSADDVAMPERTETLVRAWDASGRRAGLIYSRFTLIDKDSRMIDGDTAAMTAGWDSVVRSAFDQSGPTNPSSSPFGHGTVEVGGEQVRWVEHAPKILDLVGRKVDVKASGCTNTTSATLFRTFGSLLPEIVLEDMVLVFRSALMGPILFVDKPLVKYRRHGDNFSEVGSPKRNRRLLLQWNITYYNQIRRDLQVAANQKIIQPPLLGRIDKEISRQLAIYKTQCECMGAPRIRIFDMAWKLVKSGAGPRTITAEIARMLRRPLGSLGA